MPPVGVKESISDLKGTEGLKEGNEVGLLFPPVSIIEGVADFIIVDEVLKGL